MRILIVDDEITKADDIARYLNESGVASDITHLTHAVAARRALRDGRFDLMIVDVRLAATLGDQPRDSGGFEFLDVARLDDAAHVPDVVFITSQDHLVSEARHKAADRGALLLEFAQPEYWKRYLLGKAKAIALYSERAQADVAILTALRDPELSAVLRLPYAWREARYAGDPTLYHVGALERGGRKLIVVAANANRKGMPSSSALATKMVTKFRPACLVMTGICAGIQSKTSLGDIVVADPTWDYGSGKRAVDTAGSSVFLAAPYQSALDSGIRVLADQLSRDASIVREIKAAWEGDTPEGSLRALVGPMASGASVIADDEEARAIALQQRDLVAIEMEAYGVMAAIEYSADPKPLALVVKSVCDFADPNKRDKWQSYAAYTSAAFVDRLLRNESFPIK